MLKPVLSDTIGPMVQRRELEVRDECVGMLCMMLENRLGILGIVRLLCDMVGSVATSTARIRIISAWSWDLAAQTLRLS